MKNITLKLGGIFDGDELIVELDNRSMRTIRCESGIESEGEYDIRTFMYSIHGKKSFVKVKCNGHGEVYKNDKMYPEYRRRLKEAKLWKPEEEAA